jgi:uncharacterized protein YjiS (DUF1127 family)
MFNHFARHRSIPAPRWVSPAPENRDKAMTRSKELKHLLSRWLQKRRQRRALSQLTDSELRDIGITRYDAAKEAAKPFWK